MPSVVSYIVLVTVCVGAVIVVVLVVEVTTVDGTWRYEAQNAVAELCCFADVHEFLTFGHEVDVAALLAGINCAAATSSAAMTMSRVSRMAIYIRR